MSQNNSQKSKFPGYPNNQPRGHADFGQAGYPQQYAFTQTLSAVPGSSAHDMNKQVSAGQPGMYSNSGGIPAAAAQHHHHQPGMGGPAPSPQPTSLVQSGQQINRAHMSALPAYYTRSTVPRTMQNMGRNPLTTVVNQSAQPQTSFNQMHMVPSHTSFHPMPPLIVNPLAAQLYQQRQYSAQQNVSFIPSQVYLNNCGNFSNQPPPNYNGYFQTHAMSSYSPSIQPQQIPQMPTQTQQRKRLAIIDPKTGKDILVDGVSDENSAHPQLEKETVENSDPNICVQFATQVAAALAKTEKSEPLSKSSSIEGTSIIDTQPVICSTEIEAIENVNETEISELGDICEQFTEGQNIVCADESAISFYTKDNELNSINENSYENDKCMSEVIESIPVSEIPDSNIYDELPEELTVVDCEESKTDSVQLSDINLVTEKTVSYYAIPDIENKANVQLISDISSCKTHEIEQQNSSVTGDIKVQSANEDLCEVITPTGSSKTHEKFAVETKKNKTKKKKDLNKRGESKEGGEMDAFLDKGEETAPIASPIPPPVASVPSPVENRSLSPVPIVDSEILNSIPLPGEMPTVCIQQNDASSSEPPSETSSVSPSAENEDKENISEEAQNKIVLKYSYKEDQWSPLNPEGKKQYDRDFLLQLQSQPMSLCKPINLPNLDVIKDKAHIQRLTEVNRTLPMPVPLRTYNDPFMPTYARGGAPRPPHPAINRRSQQGREKPKKVISFSSSLNQAVKLHESENAWKPTHKLELSPDEKAETEDLYRRVRGILNKLTPQKFETLVEQVKNLDINTEEKLDGVIALVFEKAIDEPNFSVPYANMCKQLALIKVPLAGQPGQHVNFRKLLLTKCQKEFEQDKCDELNREDRMKAIEMADSAEKRKELQLEYDEEEKKMRYRQLGNIRFIGELFKLSMLIEPIMHECIRKLLSQQDEESLECLCRLLKTIGKELDETKGNKTQRENNPMDSCFNQMQRIVDKRLTSSRVRFMLQDVIDLKRNNWIPRRDENNPKTIDQIHKEAEREAREQQQVLQNMTYAKRMPDDRDRRKNTGRNMGPAEDGWTPSSKSTKGSYSVVDPTKLKLTKPDEVESIRLGPGGRGPQSWGRGSSGGTKTASVDSDMKTALTNRYSALADNSLTSVYEGRRGSQRSAASSRESSRGRNNQLPPTIRKTPSTSKERENLLETVKGMAGRNAASEPKPQEVKSNTDTHVNGKTVEVTAMTLKGPELTEEEIEKKTKPLVDEFLHNGDYEEAVKCVMELASPGTVYIFINAAVNQVLERSSQARYLLGQLLYSLVKKDLITLEEYKKGLSCVLENLDDFALDIPLIWDYMGEILEPMVEDNKLPLTFLKDVLQPCIPSQTAGKLVSAVLHCAAKKKGTIKLGEVWRESGLQWTDFLGTSANVSEFIHLHKLEFTVSPTKIVPKAEMTTEDIKKHLISLLGKSEESEEIFDWIDANLSEDAISEPSFIRALVTAVHEDAITGTGLSCKLDVARLKKRLPILTRYINHNETSQLQALYAIQSLTNKLNQPKGVLRQIFDILYDDDVISEESFKQWEKSDDPNELEGKGVAMHSVKSFFTWLLEADTEESVDND